MNNDEQDMNWNDGKIFLAVARAGQMLAAARQLGLSQATVGRRLTALETALGVSLLERYNHGCDLTEQGRVLMSGLERIEAEFITALDSAADGACGAVSGVVRVGAPDGFGVSFLAPRLGILARRYPNLVIELVPIPHAFSLSQREADIAVMIGRPIQGRLVARKLTDYSLGLYASPHYLDIRGRPGSIDDLREHSLVGYVEDLIYADSLHYTKDFFGDWKSNLAIASVMGQMEAVRQGAGIGILHDYIAAGDPGLVPVFPALKVLRSYWIVSHETLREVRRIQVVKAFLAEIIGEPDTVFVKPGS